MSLHENTCSESPAEAEMMPAGLLPQAGPVSKSYSMYTCHLAVHAAASARHTQCIWPREGALRDGPEDTGSRGGGGGTETGSRSGQLELGASKCSPGELAGLEKHLLAAWWLLLIKESQHPGNTP